MTASLLTVVVLCAGAARADGEWTGRRHGPVDATSASHDATAPRDSTLAEAVMRATASATFDEAARSDSTPAEAATRTTTSTSFDATATRATTTRATTTSRGSVATAPRDSTPSKTTTPPSAKPAATSDGATSDGATSDGATSDGATADGATSDDAATDGAAADDATSDDAAADGATSDGAAADGATADGATSDGATSDGATSDGATSDDATSDDAATDGAAGDGATPADAARSPSDDAADADAGPDDDDASEADADDELEDRVRALEDELASTKAHLEAKEQADEQAKRFHVSLSGYVDVGFFAVQGDGSGVRTDVARDFPAFGDLLSTWVLVGDPLATAINSRGDVADTGASRAIRFDPVHSQGRPTFLVNNVNLKLAATVGDDFAALAMVDFLPRFRDITDPGGLFAGDYLDVKLAWVRYLHAFSWGALTVFVGKTDSILGLEYRTQEAPQRLTITPSLICRYTCGRPLGVTAFGTFLGNRLEVALALTNGSHQVETFPFSNEVDWNRFKTGTGRLALRLPVGRRLELNVSGAVGSEDRQPDDSVLQWHVGAAGVLEVGPWRVSAEFVTGRAVGKPGTVNGANVPCAEAACLVYRGAYGLVGFFGLPVVAPYVRVDWREATMRDGRNWAYVSDAVRATMGVTARLHANVQLKAEYVFNRQVLASAATSRSVEFPDDVFTSSLVVSF